MKNVIAHFLSFLNFSEIFTSVKLIENNKISFWYGSSKFILSLEKVEH